MKIKLGKNVNSFLYGLIFGFTSPVPGVSAGTVAVLLNVFDDFFSEISIEYVKKNIFSIALFLFGWAVGLLNISRIMVSLLESHEQIVKLIFIGLILACIPRIYRKATAKKVKIKNVILGVFAFALMVLAFFGGNLVANNTIAELGELTPTVLAWIFFASFISSIAMLIPGVGGALLMLVLGIYTIYLESIATLNILLLAVFFASMVLGVLVGIFLTKKMLEKISQTLYFAILGFIIGSLLFLFPDFSLS